MYFERKSKAYLLVDVKSRGGAGMFECVGELLIDNDPKSPMICSSSCSPGYLYQKCRRAPWGDMPRVWRKALRPYIGGTLKSHRGLHRMATR